MQRQIGTWFLVAAILGGCTDGFHQNGPVDSEFRAPHTVSASPPTTVSTPPTGAGDSEPPSTTASRIQSWRGPDGMQVVLVPKTGGFVSIDLTVHTGAMDDPPDRQGLAHLCSKHMLFGTARLDSTQFDDRLADLAAQLRSDVDVTSTTLNGEVVARNAGALLELMAEVLREPNADLETFEKVKRLIVGRIELDREDDQLMAIRMFTRAAFENHPYARWPNGNVGSVLAIEFEDLLRFRTQWYRNAHITLTVAGDIEREALEGLVAEAFPEDGKPQQTRPERPFAPHDGRRVVLVDKPDRTQNQIIIGHRVIPPRDERWGAFVVATVVLGGNFSSRLHKDLRATRGWTYSIATEFWRQPDAGTFVSWTFMAPDRAVDGIKAMLGHIEVLAADGISESELATAKAYAAGNFALQTDTPARLALETSRFLALGLTVEDVASWPTELQSLELDAVNTVIAEVVSPQSLAIVMLCTAEHYDGQFTDLDGVRSIAVAAYDED